MSKRLSKAIVAFVMLISLVTSSFMTSATSASWFGGYNWAPCQNYDTGTNWVNNSADKLTANFNATSDNAAGIWTGEGSMGEDWTNFKTISFTVTSDVAVNFSFAAQTAATDSWPWHESKTFSIAANTPTDIVIDVDGSEWKTESSGWLNNTTLDGRFSVHRATLMIRPPEGSSSASGNIEFTNWSLVKDTGSGGTADPVKGFYVKGNTLYDANDNPFVIRGVNYAYTWFQGSAGTAIPQIASLGANTVRIVLSNGTHKGNWGKDNAASLKNILDLCEKNNLIAVVEVQDTTDYDDEDMLLKAAEYFAEMKDVLIGREDKVIINIANEWPTQWNVTDKWVAGYTKAIPIIRNAGLTHTIMIDSGGYGQDANTVHSGGKQVFEADPLKNTMFSIHMYESAGKDAATVKSNIDKTLDQGLALCIGEFGWQHYGQSVDAATIMSYCQGKGVGWMAWSWYGNSDVVAYLDMTDSNGNLLDWGKTIVNGANGWNETSVICSVFTTSDITTTTTDTTTTTTSDTVDITTTTPGPVGPGSKGFYIDGTTLYDANGVPFVMRGMNYSYTWYKYTASAAIPKIASYGANTIRIVLSNGQQWSKDDVNAVKNLLELCEENNLIAVLEVHDATGSANADDLIMAANYFIEIKDAIVGKEDRVIINIANEWYGPWESDPWAEGNIQAINILREAGLTHTIMIDAAGWGQYPKSIHDYGKDVFNSDPLKNTMFSIHMYEYSGANEEMIKNNIDGVLNQGLALCIGEFGWKHSNGDVDEAAIMSYCQQTNTGWIAWSWHGNSGGVEYLDLVTDANGITLTEWGNTVVNGINGLNDTSKKATVFDPSYQVTTTTTDDITTTTTDDITTTTVTTDDTTTVTTDDTTTAPTGETTTEPVSTTTPEPIGTTRPGFIPKYGDVNQDADIGLADIILLCKALADDSINLSPEQNINADVTHDGIVDVSDALKILRYLCEFLTYEQLET